jgi:inward rectifier potassium channel
LAAVWYILANTAFAAVFVALGPDALDGLTAPSTLEALSEAFFFSAHTFATIGYGDVTPASWQADVFVTL